MQKKFLFIGIISSFSLISSFFVNNVEAVGTCTIKDEYTWTGNASNDGPRVYSKPVIEYIGGTVLDKDLNSHDYKVTQDWTQDRKKEKWNVTEYEESGCGETNNYETWKFIEYIDAADTSGTETGTATVVRASGESNTDGVVYFVATATMNGKSADPHDSAKSYWVKDVSISISKKDSMNKEGNPTVNCTILYGDDVWRSCSSGEIDVSGTTNLINSNLNTYLNSFFGDREGDALKSFWVADINNGPETLSITHATRILESERKDAQSRMNSTTPEKTPEFKDTSGMKEYVAQYEFGHIHIFSYKDKHTGKSAQGEYRKWQVAVADIEDEGRSPTKKEVYTRNPLNQSGNEAHLTDKWENVSCTIYYFGPLEPFPCPSGSKDIKEDAQDIDGDSHTEGTESMQSVLRGQVPVVGDWYEYNYYIVDYSDGPFTVVDSDWRTIVWAQKVQVNDAYMTSDDGGGSTLELVDGTNRDIVVKETHNRETKTRKDYPTHQGYIWHAWEETYENYVAPTCKITYAPSISSPGYRYEKSCVPYRIYDYDPAKLYMGGKEFNYELGKGKRAEQNGYLINGIWASIDYNYYYPTDIEIKFSNGNNSITSYQDEPYPNMTCTKFYEGFTRSCLDRMFITSDTGQNENMGGTRVVNFKYINNDYSDTATLRRVYANSINLSYSKTSGKTGVDTRQYYYATLNWQNGTKKDISTLNNVWRSYVSSTGETVNFIGETWLDGYTDAKGKQHKPDAINQLYIPDPISKRYIIESEYPKTQFNNGLIPGWSYVGDSYAPVTKTAPFDVIGIKRVDMFDETDYVDVIDLDKDGNQLDSPFNGIIAEPFTGSQNAPNSGFNPVLAFNNKTYQTGSFYNLIVRITWDDGTEQRAYWEKTPEATWRYRNAVGDWKYDYSDYPIPGHTIAMPNSGEDHRLLLEGWNSIRFDMFSESSIRRPSGQDNAQYQKTFTVANLWAHVPKSLVIVGPSVTDDPSKIHEYEAFLNFDDGDGRMQDTTPIGRKDNPWKHYKPIKITNKVYNTVWWLDENKLTTPESGPLQTRLDQYEGDLQYRTISSWFCDKNRVLPNFSCWDSLYGELDILISTSTNQDPDNNCSDTVPTMNCPLPTDNNYRMPKNEDISQQRQVGKNIRIWVTGVSSGTGDR